MRNTGEQQAEAQLDEIGGAPLNGSGLEDETPDPSFEIADPNPATDKRRRSRTKKERHDVE